ncbi:MAG: Na/Pi cotransporter family protein [Christensenellaceae bacterium]|nr:Na/Pi cotransporter family protein [Christensenellaceae bacterium]
MNVLSLFGGLGLFLFGMKVLGEGLEKAAGNRLRHLLEMVTQNRLLAMLAGVAITALIQSSAATTVMVVGFVNADLLSLTQAVGVIMGANIGTTVTPLMLSLQIDFAAIFACLGLVLNSLPEKHASARQFGQVVMGMGILFVGMNTMSAAMAPLKDWEGFQTALQSVSNPLVLVLIGAGITALLHSSAASIGILQVLVAEGVMPLSSAIFVLFGQNIGTCVTALIACSGTNITAKRAAMVHLLFNVIGTALFTIIAIVLPFASWIEVLAPGNLRLQIAVTHIFFNIVTTALLLPLAKWLEQTACLLVPGEGQASSDMKLMYFDARLLKTPPFAAAQLFKEVQRMGDIALKNFTGAVDCFREWDAEKAAEIEHNEEVLDYLNQAITARLVDVKGLDLNDRDTRLVGSLFHVVNDFERVGDHSQNILEAAQLRSNDGVKFSMKAISELDNLSAMVLKQLDVAMRLFRGQVDDPAQLSPVEADEQAIDELTDALRTHHVDRLKSRKCSAKNGMIYLDMLTNLERIGDHAENIAKSASKAKQ